MSSPLDALGKFLMINLRDKAFETTDSFLSGHSHAPVHRALQDQAALMSEDQRNLVRQLVRSVVDSAIHDFLFALQEQNDAGGWPRIVVGGINVAEVSDGLHGEPFGVNGWRARFSRFGETPE